MKSPAENPQKTDKFTGVTIGNEYTGPEKIEYICSDCSRTLVKLSDGNGNHDLFCTYCSGTYDMEDESVRHKQRLSVPEETEPAVTSIQTDITKEVEIRHTVPLRGGFKSLSEKGLRFTSYSTTEKE